MQPNGHADGYRGSASAQVVATRRRLILLLCTCGAALFALVSLSGWALGDPRLGRLHLGFATIYPDTAVVIVLIACARLARGRVSTWFAAPAAAIAAMIVTEYLTGFNLGIDTPLFSLPVSGPHPGRPTFATAASVLLLALTCLPAIRRRRRVCETLTITVFAAAFLAILGDVYSVDSLYAFSRYATVGGHTAGALVLLAVAGLAADDRGVLAWTMAGNKPGATLMRIILPVSFIVLPVVGYACVTAENRGWLSGIAVVALSVLFCLTTLIAAGWLAGVRLDRIDTRRRRALTDLSALAEDLERQVIERSGQLQRGRDELVLLADRQRIAADLHDIVVQRLFATGMMLNSVDPASVEASIGKRIDDAIEAMDAAIMDLRASIFELSSSTTRSNDLLSSLDALCTDASRVLGFQPDLTVDDPDDAGADIHAEILAVARESLANVARHAAASTAKIVLRCNDGVLSLEIIDDGVGMTLAPHSSGTQNMTDRARRLGGDCAWLPIEPHGTRVRWYVPACPNARSIIEPARPKELVT